MDRVVKDMAETLRGGLHVEYTTGGGLFLSHQDKTEASAAIQDIMYADDLALAAETRSELHHMLNVLYNICKQWGMNNGEKTMILIIYRWKTTGRSSSITNHTSEPCTAGSGVYFVPWKSGGSNWKGGEGSDFKDRDGWNSVPDLEEISLSKPQLEQRNYEESLSNHGDVSTAVQC